jgi:hypothetical protein
LQEDFKGAMKRIRQNRQVREVKCILGISYGKQKTTVKKGFITQVCGQAFWHLASEDRNFYVRIVEPLGHRAKELNDVFRQRKTQLMNKFTGEFISEFCHKSGEILWDRLIQFNSGNMSE